MQTYLNRFFYLNESKNIIEYKIITDYIMYFWFENRSFIIGISNCTPLTINILYNIKNFKNR